MDIITLVNLSSRAWSLDILAALAAGTRGRQAALLTATGAGRTAFAASLAHLVELGMIERNPGHGHPLRPEFLLTAKGKAAAEIASNILGVVSESPEVALIRRNWTIPILAVTGRPRYFGEIRRKLYGVSDRSLAKSLRQLESRAWVQRHVDVSMRPPRATYEAIHLGAELHKAINLADPVSWSSRV